MALSVALHRKIVDFLISLPNVNDNSGRQTLIFRAALDAQLQGQIRFSEPPVHFFELLVPQLVQYGQLEDGRNALEAVLEAAKDYIGQDRREYCDSLIQQSRVGSNVEEPPPSSDIRLGVQLLLGGDIQDFNERKHQALITVIAEILDIERPSIRISHVTPATSFHVIVELLGDSALELVALFKTKDKRVVPLLHQFSVKSINIAEGEERGQSPKKLLMLPRRPRFFVDRKKELEQICKALESFQVVQIRGLGGIGKTELAIEAAYRMKKSFSDGVIWLSTLENTTEYILNVLATAFEILVNQMSLEEKKVAIQKSLATKKALLILDNVEDVTTVKEILDVVTHWAVLITNRPHVKILNAVLIDLDALPQKSAIELFELISQSSLLGVEHKLVENICQRLGSFPLAIELAAKQVRIAHIDLNMLLEGIEKATFDVLEANFIDDRSVRTSFLSTYQILAGTDKELFATFGTFTGRSISLEAIKAVSENSEVESTLYKLIALSLVKFEEGRYSLHPLLKEFAREQLSSSEPYKKMAEYFTEYAQANTRDFISLEGELANLLGAIDWSYKHGEYKLAVELVEAIIGKDAYYGFLAQHGYWNEALYRLRQAIEASQRLSETHKTAKLSLSLGLFYYWLGENDKARETYGVAQEDFEKVGDSRGLIHTYWRLGYIEDDEDNYDIAEKLYRKSLMMSTELDHKDLIPTSRELVGVVKYHQGHYEEARAYMEQALRESIALSNWATIARSQRRLAAVIRMQASITSDKRQQHLLLDESRQLLSDCLKFEKSKRSRARALRQFGMLEQIARNIVEAKNYFEQSLELFRKLNNKKGIAAALYNLGTVLEQQNDLEGAEKLYRESLALGKAVKVRMGIALNLRQLGLIAHKYGNREKAVELITEAVNILKKIQSPYLEATIQLTNDIIEQKLPPRREILLSPPAKPKVYHNLPQPAYGHFVGREEELSKVHRILQPYPHSQYALVAIDGVGGIGKSALALEIAHHYLRNYYHISPEQRFEAIIWMSAKQKVLTPETIDKRRQALSTLEDIYIAIAIVLQREDITHARLEEQSEVVRHALTQQRTLLIVDNLDTVDDEAVMDFLRELPAPTKAIVTTRYRLDVPYPIRLVGISSEDGQQLIAQECEKKGVTLSDEEAQRLYDHTGGVPLAIVWCIAQMGFGYNVETVLTRLGQPNSNIARFCFEVSMERIQGKPAYTLLPTLSSFTTDASREALGYVANLPKLDLDEGLVQLEKLSLVNKKGDRFWLLPLAKTFVVIEKNHGGPSLRFGHVAQDQLEDRMKCFSWLHLTDLHRGMKEQSWLWPGVREIFFDDLKKLHEKCGLWDLVLFTGDLTQCGSAEEFQRVNELLEQLWEYFSKLGSSPRLLVVPGNHDLVRPDNEDPAVLLLQDWLNRQNVRMAFWENAESLYRQVVTKAFENYTAWWDKQSFKVESVNPGILPGDFSTTIEKDGARLGILGLNTSFLQLTDDNYEGKLALHAIQFHEACDGDGPAWAKQHHTCLLLTHHPPVWLNSASQQYLKGEITAHGRFVVHLCGHLHETAYRDIAEGGAETRRIWQSRSLFGLEYFGKEGEGQRLHGYTAGKIELSENTGTLLFWPREARLQGGQRSIVPDYSLKLTDDQHTNPRDFELLQPYIIKEKSLPLETLPDGLNGNLDRHEIRERYIEFFVAFCKQQIGTEYWDGLNYNFNRVGPEMENLFLALDWAFESENWKAVQSIFVGIVHPTVMYRATLIKRVHLAEKALIAAEKLGDIEMMAWLHIDALGYAFRVLGKPNEALDHIKTGQLIANENDLVDCLAAGDIELANLARQRGDSKAMLRYAESALSKVVSPMTKPRAHIISRAHTIRAYFYIQQGEWEKARELFLTAIKVASEVDNDSDEARSQLRLGEIYLKMREIDSAEKVYLKTQMLAEECGWSTLFANSIRGLAKIYEHRGATQPALDYLEQAKTIYEQLGWADKLEESKDPLLELES